MGADVRAAVPDTKAMKVKAAMKLYDDAQKGQRSADLNQAYHRRRRLGWKPSDVQDREDWGALSGANISIVSGLWERLLSQRAVMCCRPWCCSRRMGRASQP